MFQESLLEWRKVYWRWRYLQMYLQRRIWWLDMWRYVDYVDSLQFSLFYFLPVYRKTDWHISQGEKSRKLKYNQFWLLFSLDLEFVTNLRVAPCNGVLIPDSWKSWLVESGIMCFGIRNTAQEIRNPTNDWNPEFKFHWHRIHNPVPEIRNPPLWNPESKTVLDYFIWGEKRW